MNDQDRLRTYSDQSSRNQEFSDAKKKTKIAISQQQINNLKMLERVKH